MPTPWRLSVIGRAGGCWVPSLSSQRASARHRTRTALADLSPRSGWRQRLLNALLGFEIANKGHMVHE